MTEISSPSRASAQTFLRRLFVAFVLPWAFISAQAASAHIAPVSTDTTVSAAAGKSFVADVRNGVPAVKVERGAAQSGKSPPALAIVADATRAATCGTLHRAGFAPFLGAAAIRAAPADYWSRGPPPGAVAFDIITSI